MSEWRSLHQELSARRTRHILDQGFFSDVDILVQGQVFHCHRYVLAQSSEYFFSRFTQTPENLREEEGATLSQEIPCGRRQLIFDDDTSSVSSPDGASVARRLTSPEADSFKYQQDILLEELGVPAKRGSLLLPRTDSTDVHTVGKSEGEICQDPRTNSSGCSSLSKNFSNSDFSSNSLKSPPSRHNTVIGTAEKASERSGPKLKVKLTSLSPGTFRAILEAVYCGNDPVTHTNILALYKASADLQISSLLKHCEQTVCHLLRHQQVEASQIIHDAQMAENFIIVQTALEVLLTDFGPDSSKADWFLKLSPEKFLAVLDDPRLNVRHEDEIYRALLDWYEHDPWTREQYVARALKLIRLANLNKRILVEDILPHPLCSGLQNTTKEGAAYGDGNDVALTKLVHRALTYHLLPDRRHDEMLSIADFRPSQDSERVLLVLGDQSNRLYAFSFARKAWFKLAPPPKALGLGVAACCYGDDLYVTGGDKAMTGFYRYRARVNSWKQLSDLKVGRRSHCCAAVGDCLYVLGGKDDKQSFKRDTMDSVEVFHIKDKGQGWNKMTEGSLVVPVRSMACAVVGEHIYVFGGRTNGMQKTVDAIQCLDTRTRQCSLIAHLSSPSCLARSFVADNVVYLLDTNGDVLRFHPKNLHHHPKTKETTTYTGSGNPHSAQDHATNGAPQSLQLGRLEQRLQELGGELQNYSSIVLQACSKTGSIPSLNWKWFGVARSHDGTLYVVAGECPPSFVESGAVLSAVVDDDTVVKNVRFVCPEKMAMCYVNAHMCVPKSFLLEKVV